MYTLIDHCRNQILLNNISMQNNFFFNSYSFTKWSTLTHDLYCTWNYGFVPHAFIVRALVFWIFFIIYFCSHSLINLLLCMIKKKLLTMKSSQWMHELKNEYLEFHVSCFEKKKNLAKAKCQCNVMEPNRFTCKCLFFGLFSFILEFTNKPVCINYDCTELVQQTPWKQNVNKVIESKHWKLSQYLHTMHSSWAPSFFQTKTKKLSSAKC